MDFRALKAGISGILGGEVDGIMAKMLSPIGDGDGDWWCPAACVDELWLLLRRLRKGGISGICIGWDTALIEEFLFREGKNVY